MTGRRIAFGLASIAFLVALIWWVPWCFHALRGWTAAPLGWTVGLILYGGIMGCGLMVFRGKI